MSLVVSCTTTKKKQQARNPTLSSSLPRNYIEKTMTRQDILCRRPLIHHGVALQQWGKSCIIILHHKARLKKQWHERSCVVVVLFVLWVTLQKNKKKTTMESGHKKQKKGRESFTFKVLTSTRFASSWLAPPLSTLLKILPSSGSWSCGNSKPLNFNARSQVNPKPKCSSFPWSRWVEKERMTQKKAEGGGRWVGGRKGSG